MKMKKKFDFVHHTLWSSTSVSVFKWFINYFVWIILYLLLYAGMIRVTMQVFKCFRLSKLNLFFSEGDEMSYCLECRFLCTLTHFPHTNHYNVFVSWFQRTSSNLWGDWMGVMHGDEIEYVFGRPLNLSTPFTDQERELSLRIIQHFSRFALSGCVPTLWFLKLGFLALITRLNWHIERHIRRYFKIKRVCLWRQCLSLNVWTIMSASVALITAAWVSELYY